MKKLLACALVGALSYGAVRAARAAQSTAPDPFAGNNTVYPAAKDWPRGAFRTSNFDYPVRPVVSSWQRMRPNVALTKATAPAYVEAVKKFIERDMSGLLNDPLRWSPQQAGWYDMPWGGQGSTMSNGEIDPSTGREALLGSYTGQILQNSSYPGGQRPTVKSFQNHAVVYYNDVAAAQLGKVWKNPFRPDLSDLQYPDGSIALKVEGVTLVDSQWPSRNGPPVLAGSSVSYLFRPSVASMENEPDPTKRVPVVTPIRFLQMAVRIKDRIASPRTGWVFIAFTYDSRSKGVTVWDRTRAVGAMWGNDPQLDKFENGLGPDGVLQETWVNSDLPDFVKFGLGWGGRLAGPLDVGLRHNVVTVSGKRYNQGNSFPASSCVSCHGSAQYPFIANLYPSPNMHFPLDGNQFLMYDPGTPAWSQWFQNRSGRLAMSARGRTGIIAADYDMMLTFALATANAEAGGEAFSREKVHGH